MSEGILGNATGGFGFPKTYIIADSDGNELVATYVESETIFTATDNDVREGMVYASDSGVSEGKKNIPAYRTERGTCMIFDGEELVLADMEKYEQYDYTQLQCIIAPFNSSVKESVASDKIVLYDSVYPINSITPLSTVSKNANDKSISLNLVNNSGQDYIIHYFTYREEV
jgi:hypothetical protein